MDGMTAQARRFYHHVESGGSLSKSDVGRMVEYCEAKDAEIARLTAERDAWKANAEELAEAMQQYKHTLCEGFCGEDGWSDAGHSHPDYQRDCGGCLAAVALATHKALMKGGA